MFIENQYPNIDGNPYIWDTVVLEAVRAEPNIRLFLNTDVHEAEADGPENNRTIRSLTGGMMASERRIRFESRMYLDCTGDGRRYNWEDSPDVLSTHRKMKIPMGILFPQNPLTMIDYACNLKS